MFWVIFSISWCILGFIGSGYLYKMFAWTGIDAKYNRGTQVLSRVSFVGGPCLLLVTLVYIVVDRDGLSAWKNPFVKLVPLVKRGLL